MFNQSTTKICTSILTCTLLIGCSTNSDEKENDFNENDIKKISETMGHLVIENLNSQNLNIDIESLIKGIEDAKAGSLPPLTQKEFVKLMGQYRKKAFELKSSSNLKLAEDFLDDNYQTSGIVSIENGKVQYLVLKKGFGDPVKENQIPLIRYEGRFIDGKVFDSTEKRGQPIRLPLNSTIEGFKLGVIGMQVGEKRRLFIHPDLGYGKKGKLPPNSLLIFDIEIVQSDKNPNSDDSNSPDKGELEKNQETGYNWLRKWTGT